MASTDEVDTEILQPMRSLFRVPFGIEAPERALIEYANVLRRHSVMMLRTGWARMLETYRRRDWPSIYEFIEIFDTLHAEEKRLRDLASAADKQPDPFETFCSKVLAFVKRDRRTFEAFRDAGVRAIRSTEAVGFDTEALATSMREAYGDQLDAMVGRPVVFTGPGTGTWEHNKWDAFKEYSVARPAA